MKLTDNDLKYVVSRLPSDVRALIKDNPGRVYLAGGFIRAVVAGEEPSDVDLFGSNSGNLQGLASTFAASRQGARTYTTGNAITVLTPERLAVQFITRWNYADPQHVAESFDFTVCAAVVWFAEGFWQSSVHDSFYQDLAARRLTYTSPVRDEEAGGSMLRAIKYIKRGYVIQVDSLAGVIARLTDSVRDGTGTEEKVKVITGLLREVDPSQSMDQIEVAGAEVDFADFDKLPSPVAGVHPAYGTA